MKKLLIGLLMLVTTNLMANEPIEQIPPAPSFKIHEATKCIDNTLYHLEWNEVSYLAQQVWEYDPTLKDWAPILCVEA